MLEKRLYNSRALTAGLLVLAAMLTLLGRMVYLQVFAHQELTTLSDSNRVRLEPLVPTRGLQHY